MAGKGSELLETITASIRWVWNPLKGIIKPVLTPIVFGAIFYMIGWNLRTLPEVEIALTNGFYILGYNINFKFADFFGTIAFTTSFIAVVFRASYGGGGGSRQVEDESRRIVQLELEPDDIHQLKVQIEDISGNLSLITLSQEKILQKRNILDIDDVSKMKPIDLISVLSVSPSLAQRIIEEALETLTDWRRKGLL